MQPNPLKEHMVTIGLDQSLSKNELYGHRCLENIGNLYKYYGKCDDQQHYKAILELSMVSTNEVFSDRITMSLIPYVSVKKSCTRKQLCQFSGVLD